MSTRSRETPSRESAERFAERVADSLNEVLELAKQPLSGGEFYRELIQRVVAAFDADFGCIWKVKSQTAERIATCSRIEAGDASRSLDPELEWLHRCREGDQSHYHPLGAQSDKGTPGRRSLHPLVRDPQVVLVLDLVWQEDQPWIGSGSYESVIHAIRELTGDFHRNSELGFLRARQEAGDQLLEFARRIHRADDDEKARFEIVNAAPKLLGVDRAAILTAEGRHYRLSCVSGLPDIAPRSDLVNAMEKAAARAVADGQCGQPLEAGKAGESENPWGDYLSRSGGRRIGGYLIDQPPGQRDGGQRTLLLLETLDEGRPWPADNRLVPFLELADSGMAIARARSQRGWRRMGASLRMSRGWQKALGGLALLTAAILALFLIPAELRIKAAGQLLPREQQGIFAPADGEIVSLLVHQGEEVRKGQPLMQLFSADLELRLTRLQGEYQATLEKLQAIESRRIVGEGLDRETTERDSALLSASAGELEILRDSQRAQLAILREFQQSLEVRSPLDGRIVTWQPGKLLEARPVKRGQLLMTVANTAGDWMAELEIQDRRVGEVLKAQNGNDRLVVTFFPVSRPEQVFKGRLELMDLSTGEDSLGLPAVRASVAFEEGESANLRPGARIVARIHCGRKSLAHVWFHEIVSSVRTALF